MVVRLSILPQDRVEARENTHELKQAIERVDFVGVEEPTFLQCTDCKKMTCPNCCGICPIEGCRDTECRKCKKGDPWNPCSLHETAECPTHRVGSKLNESARGTGSTPMSLEALALRKEWIEKLEEHYAREEMKGAPPAFWHQK